MEEKYMVNDILEGTIQEIRNSCETFQYDLFRVANLKGYYTPAAKATQTEIEQVKTEVQQ